MPVIERSRTYTDIARPLDTGIDWLIGNVGVWKKLTLELEFEVAINFSTTNNLFMEEPNQFTLTDGSNWRDNGFEVGDSFEIKWTTTDSNNISQVYTVTGTIVQINDDIMISDNSTLGGGAQASNIYPYQGADIKAHSVFIRANKQPVGIDFEYGHILDSQFNSTNLASLIDSTRTRFEAKDTDTLTIGVPLSMTPLSTQSGMAISNVDLIYRGVDPTNSFKYLYDIEVTFMICTIFEDITNIEDKISPDWFASAENITDNFRVTGYPTYNNPNVTITNDLAVTKKRGNTGWFDENYNGLPNDFTKISITYTDLASNSVNQLDFANTVRATAVIDGVSNIGPNTRCMFGFAWIPIEETAYKNKTTPFYKNLKFSTGGTFLSDVFPISATPDPIFRQGYSADGASMDTQNVQFQQTGPNEITFSADFIPNAAFTSFFQDLDPTERQYIIWVSVADSSLTVNNSNRVSLLVDCNELDTFIAPVGEWQPLDICLYSHPQDGTGPFMTTNSDIFPEDDVLAKVRFSVDIDDVIPQDLEFAIEAVKTDGTTFELSALKVDLSGFPVDGNGVPQWNYVSTRGFLYESGNNKNDVKVIRDPANDTVDRFAYIACFGFKARWEDWIPLANVPADFFNSSELNNGQNNDWYEYGDTPNWDLQFSVYLGAQKDGLDVRYKNSVLFYMQNYESNNQIDETWTAYRDSDGALLNGGTDSSGKPIIPLLCEENVRIQVDFENNTQPFGSLSDYYGTVNLELFQGAGQFSHRQLSSIYGSESGNPLQPLTGETNLKLTLISPTIIRFECLVNPAFLDNGTQFKLSARLYSDLCNLAPELILTSTRNGTTNTSDISNFLVSAPDEFTNPDTFLFNITAKGCSGGSYTGDFELTAEAIRKDGSTFEIGTAVYASGSSVSAAPASTNLAWDSWAGGAGFHTYLTGTIQDGGLLRFRKVTWALNNSDPDSGLSYTLRNENAVTVRFIITITCNGISNIGQTGTVYFYLTNGNSDNAAAATPKFPLVNTNWQTPQQVERFLSGGGIGFVRDFYYDAHPDADYLFFGYGVNETVSGGGDNALKLSESIKDRSQPLSIQPYQDAPFRFAAIRGGYGTNTQTRVVYGCKLDYKDTNNITGGVQYPVLYSTGSGTKDTASGRGLFAQNIIGYTNESQDIYTNTKGFPIFEESTDNIYSVVGLTAQLRIRLLIDSWRVNGRPVIVVNVAGGGSLPKFGITYNNGTYAAPNYVGIGANNSGLGVGANTSYMSFVESESAIYSWTYDNSGGNTTYYLHKITNPTADFTNLANYVVTEVFRTTFATGTELSRLSPSLSGAVIDYPMGKSNLIADPTRIDNGYPVFYLMDFWGNCFAEFRNNGGGIGDITDWDYEIIVGTFGHGNPTPSRKDGVGAAAELDLLGDLFNTPLVFEGTFYTQIYGDIIYFASRYSGYLISINVDTKEVKYITGLSVNGTNGFLNLA